MELICEDCQKPVPDGDRYYLLKMPDDKREKVLEQFPNAPETTLLCGCCGDMMYELRSTTLLH